MPILPCIQFHIVCPVPRLREAAEAGPVVSVVVPACVASCLQSFVLRCASFGSLSVCIGSRVSILTSDPVFDAVDPHV